MFLAKLKEEYQRNVDSELESEINKDYRLSCSRSANTRTACSFAVQFCTEFHFTAVQKDVRVFCNCQQFFIFKRTSFVSKPMKYNKNADTLLFYCYLLRVNVKYIYAYIVRECRCSKEVKNSGFWENFTALSTKS